MIPEVERFDRSIDLSPRSSTSWVRAERSKEGANWRAQQWSSKLLSTSVHHKPQGQLRPPQEHRQPATVGSPNVSTTRLKVALDDLYALSPAVRSTDQAAIRAFSVEFLGSILGWTKKASLMVRSPTTPTSQLLEHARGAEEVVEWPRR